MSRSARIPSENTTRPDSRRPLPLVGLTLCGLVAGHTATPSAAAGHTSSSPLSYTVNPVKPPERDPFAW